MIGAPCQTASQPLVSVVVPYYDDFHRVNEAVRSIHDNVYEHIEIIIVDDCSPVPLKAEDLTASGRKRPLTILRNAQNRGPGFSRNVGIAHARGDYIAFLDSDDLWNPGMVSRAMAVFLAKPETVWVYTNGHYLVDGRWHRKPNSHYHGFAGNRLPVGREVNEQHLRGMNYMIFSGNVMKRSALQEVGLFNGDLPVSEDWDIFVRLAERFEHIEAIDEPLVTYRTNNRGRHYINREAYVEVNARILRDLYRRQGLLPERQAELDRAIAVIYQRAGIQRLNAGLNADARHFLLHPSAAPLSRQPRMLVLKALSWLPNRCYKLAVWLFDHLP